MSAAPAHRPIASDARRARRRGRSGSSAPRRSGWRALCDGMAERFVRGGRLLAVGATPAARSDVRHVAVEFVHPVIVGKRALPALGLASRAAARRAG